MTRRVRGAAIITVWVLLVAGGVAALTSLGHGQLAAPPVTHGAGALRSWAEDRDAATIFMSVVRVAALVAGWYLLAATVAGIASRLTKLAAAVRITDAVTIPSVRRLLGATAGALLIAGPASVAGSASAAVLHAGPTPSALAHVAASAPQAVAEDAPPALRWLPGGGGAPDPPAVRRLADGDPPVMTPLPPAAASGARALPPPAAPAHQPPAARGGPAPDGPTLRAQPSRTPPLAEPTPAPGAAAAPPAPDATLRTVRPGDSLWTVARSSLAAAWGRPPTDLEIAPYWRSVVAANERHLADVDLIYPGDLVTVPAPPAAP